MFCMIEPLLPAISMDLAICQCNTEHIAPLGGATGDYSTAWPRRPVISLAHTNKVVAAKTTPPKIVANRHKTDPILMSCCHKLCKMVRQHD